MEIAVKDGQAKPGPGNATSFNWWIFTCGNKNMLGVALKKAETSGKYAIM